MYILLVAVTLGTAKKLLKLHLPRCDSKKMVMKLNLRHTVTHVYKQRKRMQYIYWVSTELLQEQDC